MRGYNDRRPVPWTEGNGDTMSTTNQTESIPENADDPTGSSFAVAIRRLVLLVGPLGAALAMWFHPHAGESVYESLSPVADTFVATHLLLFASLALIAVGLYLLSAGYRSAAATLARAGTGVFAFFYLGYVAVVGVTKGLVIRAGQTLPAEQQAGVAEVVQYVHTEPLLFGAGVVGAVGYLVAVGSLAVVLHRAGAPRIPVVLLVVSTVAVGTHQGLLAVAGMASLVAAVGWLELRWTPSKDPT